MNSPSTLPDQAQRHHVRKQILANREALSTDDQKQKSALIVNTLLQQPSFLEAKTIFSYVNFRSEVHTCLLVDACFKQNKRLCVPLTIKEGFRLIPYLLTENQQLQPGYCGIPEPDPHTHSLIPASEIDLTILPGSAFDRSGGRLGYGGGYYDRFVSNEAPGATRVGLAFDLQVVEKLPLMPHDQPLHYLITESQIYNFT